MLQLCRVVAVEHVVVVVKALCNEIGIVVVVMNSRHVAAMISTSRACLVCYKLLIID